MRKMQKCQFITLKFLTHNINKIINFKTIIIKGNVRIHQSKNFERLVGLFERISNSEVG